MLLRSLPECSILSRKAGCARGGSTTVVAATAAADQPTKPHSEESLCYSDPLYDFNVYSGKKLAEKLTYMHLNPLKRNLVAHLKDWPWSSWSHYVGSGLVLIPIDRWDEPATRAENPHP